MTMAHSPILRIDRLRLHLPAGFEQRGHTIARQLAAQLAELPLGASATIERLSLPPLPVPAGAPDAWIARQLARNVRMGMGAPRPGGAPPQSISQTASPPLGRPESDHA